MGRKNWRKWALKFRFLNERLIGLNALWGGWGKAMGNNKWIHWDCAGVMIQRIYRKILQWPSKLLRVPSSISEFATIVGRKGIVYAEVNPSMIRMHEVEADKVALPKEPPDIIPVLTILPEQWAQKYAKAENLVVTNPEKWRQMKGCKPQLGMRVGEYVKVIKRLLKLGMVELMSVKQVEVVNGLHCVVKDNGKQRLIFDGRPVNCILTIPEKITLPDFSLLADWEIRKEEAIRFGKLDLDNFYHRIGVPNWLSPYLGLPPLPAEEFGGKGGLVSPVFLTLPMGLSHSVLLAQLAHLYVVRKVSLAPVINDKIRKDALGWVILYIDDVLIAARATSRKVAEQLVNNVIKECLEAYRAARLVVNMQKMEWATSEVLGLGCLISERECGIVPKEERIIQVLGATRFLLSLDSICSKEVEFLLGHWVWFVLLWRPLYSVFYHVYKWLHEGDEYTVRRLWQSVKREFILVTLFADLCKLSWRRETAPIALAMDASLWGAGACEVTWGPAQSWGGCEEGIPLKGNQLTPRVTRRLTLGLASSTIKTYAAAITKFKEEVGVVRFGDLDAQLLNYVQSFPPLSQRSVGERLGYACRHFFPEVANLLPRLNCFVHQLRRQYKGISKPSMIWDVLVLVVFQLVTMGFPVTALGALLQFDCFLRPIELARIQIGHIAFPGGRLLGSQANRVLLLLPKAKTGPLQSVRVESKLVIKLLSKITKKHAADVELFPSVSVYRQKLSSALQFLGLSHIGYTPHSIRHRAATMALINNGEQALPAIMFRGRWESSAGKSYLQIGAAALLYAEIPEALIRQAEDQVNELPNIFKHLSWTPKM